MTSLSTQWWPCWGDTPWWPGGYAEHNPWGCSPAPLRAPESSWPGLAVLNSATGAGVSLHPQPDADTAPGPLSAELKLLLAQPRSWCAWPTNLAEIHSRCLRNFRCSVNNCGSYLHRQNLMFFCPLSSKNPVLLLHAHIIWQVCCKWSTFLIIKIQILESQVWKCEE